MAKVFHPYNEARYRNNKNYDDKTYRKFGVMLRLDDDAEILKAIDEAKEHGISYRQMVNDLFYNGRSRPGGDYPIADDVERAVMDIAGGDYDRSIIPQIAEKIKMDGRYQNIVQEYVENELQ